ncbi:GNAT family N-acetyltransferase [Mesorhizobium sp. SB112]|uniref:GNAT family N-acetyltransferase n=1 Tax=Mesorhizobium sp. SB112 TaxID=3151853 RepID=UPI003265FC8F
MVDAAATVEVMAADEAALRIYEGLAEGSAFAPAQNPLWIRSWVSNVKPDGLIVTLKTHEIPVLALALEVVRHGPFRVARYMGGTHANGNFPLAKKAWLASHNTPDVAEICDAIRTARPDIDALILERSSETLFGMRNPLLALPHIRGANVALSVELESSFDQLLEHLNAKRKRKKHRAQTRKFEAAGGYRCIAAKSDEDIRNALDAYFAMKANRFREMGVTDVFAPTEVRAFFTQLFLSAQAQTPPPFVVNGLEVGGKFRAITGSSLSGDRLVCEFAGMSNDELVSSSPGEFLFFENIREACKNGLSVYDLSVGDEPYKRLWCDVETWHLDVIAPLTLKGRLLAWKMKLTTQLKSTIKNNPAIWNVVKRLRRKAARPSDD